MLCNGCAVLCGAMVQGAKGAKAAKAAKKSTAGGAAGGDDIYIETEENADGKIPDLGEERR